MKGDKNNRSSMKRSNEEDADDSDDASETVRKKASACCVNSCCSDANNSNYSGNLELNACPCETATGNSSSNPDNVENKHFPINKLIEVENGRRIKGEHHKLKAEEKNVWFPGSKPAAKAEPTKFLDPFVANLNFRRSPFSRNESRFGSFDFPSEFNETREEVEEDQTLENGGLAALSRPVRFSHSTNLLLSRKLAAVVPRRCSRLEIIFEKSERVQSEDLVENLLSILDVILPSHKPEVTKEKDDCLKVVIDSKNKNDHSKWNPSLIKDYKKVDISQCDSAVREAPMYPRGSGNKMQGTYRFSTTDTNAGSQSNYASNMNNSAPPPYRGPRPGFSSLLSNVSSVDLSPFRTGPPIRFRLGTTPRMNPKKQAPNSPSPPPAVMAAHLEESAQKEDDDVDLYSDIEHDPQQDTDEDKNFGTLEPPPEPPAMLMGGLGDEGTDEEEGLVIDDKIADAYDPAEPCDDSNDDSGPNDGAEIAVNLTRPSGGYLHSPTYTDIVAQQAVHDDKIGNRSIGQPGEPPAFDSVTSVMEPPPPFMMEPPPFPTELLEKEILNHKDKENDEECPNFSLYSSASMNLVKNSNLSNMGIMNIPVPGHLGLDIPVPNQLRPDIPAPKQPSLDIPVPNEHSLDIPVPNELSLDIPIPEPPSLDIIPMPDPFTLDIPIPDLPNVESIPVPKTGSKSKQSLKSKKKKKKKKKPLLYSVPTLEESILKERLGNYSSDDESDSDTLDEPMEVIKSKKSRKRNETPKKHKHEVLVDETENKLKETEIFDEESGKEDVVTKGQEKTEEEKEDAAESVEEDDGKEQSSVDDISDDKVVEKQRCETPSEIENETDTRIASESDDNVESSSDLAHAEASEPMAEDNEEDALSVSGSASSPKLPDDKNERSKNLSSGNEAKEKLYDGEDELSIQGDVLDIEAEANLQDANSIPDEQDELKNSSLCKGSAEKPDGDGLVDITDEEMSESDHLRETVAAKLNSLNTEAISEDEGSIADANKESEQACPALPGLEGLQTDPISDSDGNAFDESNYSADKDSEYDAGKKRKKKKKVQKEKEHSISETDDANASKVKEKRNSVDFEEGEIVDDRPKNTSKKDKKKKAKDKETKENLDRSKSDIEKEKDKKQKKGKDSKAKDKDTVLQNAENKNDENREKSPPQAGTADVSWKKLSKNTKDRNYRDGKDGKPKTTGERGKKSQDTLTSKEKDKKKEKRKELERYNVRKVLGEKVRLIGKDDFGRDLSLNRSMSRSRSRSRRKGRKSKSRSRSPYRSPIRSRVPRSRSRSRSRSKSRRRLANRKRSRSKNRAIRRSYDRSRSKSRGHSKDRSRKKKTSPKNRLRRSLSKDRASKKKKKVVEKKRNKSYSPEYSPARKRRSTSRYSWSPSWSSYSYSPSPHFSRSYSLSPTPSWSPENRTLVYNRDKNRQPKNITVIVPNADASAKKKGKKRLSKRNKENEKRKKKRDRTPAPSKEVFTSGDNILVSVNFSNNKNDGTLGSLLHTNEYPTARRRSVEVEPPSKKSKQDKNKERKSKSSAPKKNRSARATALNEAAKNAKPIAIIDLNMSPFREETPSPKEVILVTDSDLECENSENREVVRQNGSARELGQPTSVSQPESPMNDFINTSAGGPKTPPEPRIAFSISSKQAPIRTMINPLMDADEEEQIEEASNEAEMNEIFSKGPNTPPEPPPETNTPASPPTTPYDPFDPTKSRSPSPELGQQTSTPANLRDGNKSFDTLSPSVVESSDLEMRNKSPQQISDETKKTPENLRSLQKETIPILDSPKQSSPNVNAVGEGSDGVVMKILGHAKIDLTTYKSPEPIAGTPKSTQLTPKSVTPSKPNILLTSRTPVKASNIPAYTPAITLNGEKLDEAPMDISGDSPYSPGPFEVDDLFEPPTISPPRIANKLPMPPIIRSSLTKANKSKFDALFGTPPKQKTTNKLKPLPYTPKAIIPSIKGTKAAKTAKGKSHQVGVKMDEDQLKILDELPSSAVEMQVKDKYLKKLNRQERVVEEVKLVIKPHYAKKHITKEDYKEILRRAVPKICHNRSGEINPMKIHGLIEAYVRKFRVKNAKRKANAENLNNTNANTTTKRTKATRS